MDEPEGGPAAAPAPARPANDRPLGRSTAAGFLWLLLQSLSGRAASFFSQLVLAKLLMPAVFGQVGLAYTVTTLATAIVGFGVDDVLLQRLRAIDYWVAPAFWSSLGLGVAGMAIMLAAAPFAAHAYGTPALLGLIPILAITLPLGALATVPTVKLRAAMNFRFLGTYFSIETVIIAAATVALAALGFGAYSFVLPMPFAAAVKLALFWRKAPATVRLGGRRRQYNHIVGSGVVVLASKMVIEAVNQGDYIVLGLLASDVTVGIYYFAFRLANQPLQMMAGNFGAVLFPALTQLRQDPARQEAAALRASRVLAFCVTPVCFLQAAVAGPVLHLMFGARWSGAVPLVQILSLGLPGDAVAWIAGALLVARREFRRDLAYLLMFMPPFFVCVVAGALLGSSLGVAIGVSLYYAILKPINSWLVFRASMTLGDFARIYVNPPLIAGAAIGTAYLLARLSPLPIVQAAITLALGPLFYLGLMQALAPSMLSEIAGQLPIGGLVRRFRREAV